MRIILIGGTGFIGTYVLLELIKRGEKPILFDLKPPSKFIENDITKITWVKGDIRNEKQIEKVVERHQPEVIINLAALLLGGCIEYPRRAVEVNVIGLSNILEAARKYCVRRVVNASSAAAYGFSRRVMKENNPVSTNINLYGATKFLGEILCRQYIENYGIEATNLRYCGVYGPGEVRSAGIAEVIKNIERIVTGRDAVLPKISASDHMNFIFVADAALATVLAATISRPLSLVYNITGSAENYITFGEMVSLIKRMVKTSGDVIFKGSGYDRGPVDIELARRELGFEPRYSIVDGLKESIKYLFKESKTLADLRGDDPPENSEMCPW